MGNGNGKWNQNLGNKLANRTEVGIYKTGNTMYEIEGTKTNKEIRKTKNRENINIATWNLKTKYEQRVVLNLIHIMRKYQVFNSSIMVLQETKQKERRIISIDD